MMDASRLFSEFDSAIRLSESKIQKLEKARDALREKIRKYFEEHEWETPKFHSQGSFPLRTNLNPIKKKTEDGDIKEEYDLDDGVYIICSEKERKQPATYHDRIYNAVDGHAKSVMDKATCVRVVYADGHHIDLPCYWLAKNGDTPQLAHKSKGYIESDPRAFKKWVDSKISDVNSGGQLRRTIRYLKAWKDFRETQNVSLRLPSGFILTILACQNFAKDSREDLAFKNTVQQILDSLDYNFSCYRPTVPTDEDLLEVYSKEVVLGEFAKMLDRAEKALEADSEISASEYWRKIFGDRFPLGKDGTPLRATSEGGNTVRIGVTKPWQSR